MAFRQRLEAVADVEHEVAAASCVTALPFAEIASESGQREGVALVDVVIVRQKVSYRDLSRSILVRRNAIIRSNRRIVDVQTSSKNMLDALARPYRCRHQQVQIAYLLLPACR